MPQRGSRGSHGPPEGPVPLKRSELTRRLDQLEVFLEPDPRTEQVPTPAEEASALLFEALQRGDLVSRAVLDLGTGTGRLAVGAALLGAHPVTGVDQDDRALGIARENARRAGVEVRWVCAEIAEAAPLGITAPTVVMNPPFGAQRAHADRPFLAAALAALAPYPGGGLYMFANAASQAFIERWSIAHRLKLESHQRTVWPLPPCFPHHREARGRVSVDRWVLRKEGEPPP